jgi:hypothetical protein
MRRIPRLFVLLPCAGVLVTASCSSDDGARGDASLEEAPPNDGGAVHEATPPRRAAPFPACVEANTVSLHDASVLKQRQACSTFSLRSEISSKWQSATFGLSKTILIRNIHAALTPTDPAIPGVGSTQILYDLENSTINLLEYAATCGDRSILSDLVEVYSVPFEKDPAGNYRYLDHPTSTTGALLPHWEWIDQRFTPLREVGLSSAQFVYAVSRLVAILASLPSKDQLPSDATFIGNVLPIVRDSHLSRWIFSTTDRKYSVNAWGCANNGVRVTSAFNHREFVDAKLARTLGNNLSYCNVVLDHDLWIASSVLELLSVAGSSVTFAPTELARLTTYEQAVYKLVQSRIVAVPGLSNYARDPVVGTDFDTKSWYQHRDYNCVTYTGWPFPILPGDAGSPCAAAPDGIVGWDISHARRFVHVFDSLYRNRLLAGSAAFPTACEMQGFANQIAYRIFDRNWSQPRFTNFFDGTNGWHRVGFASNNNRQGFGIPPFALSEAIGTGGFLTWSAYNSDLGRIGRSIYDLYVRAATDPAAASFMSTYYGGFYINGVFQPAKRNGYEAIQIYPTLLGIVP